MIFLTQNGTSVFAHGDLTTALEASPAKELPGASIRLYYFQKISLEPIMVFQHLAGTPLRTWLDYCLLLEEVEGAVPTAPLRYVHGRSEVMKGKHFISTVLLAEVGGVENVSEAAWMSAVPGIYKAFTVSLNTGSTKKA